MHHSGIALICLLLPAAATEAHAYNSAPATDTSIKSTITLHPTDEVVDVMDSMLEDFYNSNPAWGFNEEDYTSLGFSDTDTPHYSPQIYKERIARISSPINYVYNDDVQAFIDLYTVKRRWQVENMLGLSQIYFPMFEAELDKNGMPLELKYLPVIESALNTQAVSRAGATGLWQMMYGTAKLLGLQVDSYIDERRDPHMATEAAVQYLKELHEIYNDWLLTIAAYNCGPGNVNKALRRAGGGNKTFWDIEAYLPRETRGYVPAFIAATYVFNYYHEHNIRPNSYDYNFTLTDTIMITRKLSLSDIAPFVGMDPEELAFYNPGLKTRTIPGFPVAFPLRLPLKAAALYESNEDSLYAFLDREQAEKLRETTAELTKTGTSGPAQTAASSNGNAWVTYTVKSGDNLGYISEWFDCSITDIKKWNNLRTTRIMPGQKLKFYEPEEKKDAYAQINRMNFSEKQKLSNIVLISSADTQNTTAAEQYIYYTVKPGDTLWSISKRYPENSIDKIRSMNDIAKNETLKAGTKIKLVK